ncbi:MAG: NAD(P)-dependent alcohol dehydrogenase [Nitrospinota bacterium]|nr:NAD(P)-dependent alcohol dehydrogenase [Nitrospinota bacterium]
MKAAVYSEYGPPEVLSIAEVDKPTPGEKDVLIKVHATSVTASDYNMRSLNFPARLNIFYVPSRLVFGWFRPKRQILGMEFAGEIVSAGKSVTRFKVGDQVYGLAALRVGAYAEYMLMADDAAIALKPENLSYDQAAAIPFGATDANYYLKELGNIQPGYKVLIHGASGNVGSMAVQFAKYYGAEVTGVCSGVNFELVKSLGADHVIDYTAEDFTKNGVKYDLIFDTIGAIWFSEIKRSLADNGIYLANLMSGTDILRILWTSIVGGKRIKGGVGPSKPENMEFFKKLCEEGALKPVIDRRYTLDQIVEAHRYADTKRKKGSVVITVAQP